MDKFSFARTNTHISIAAISTRTRSPVFDVGQTQLPMLCTKFCWFSNSPEVVSFAVRWRSVVRRGERDVLWGPTVGFGKSWDDMTWLGGFNYCLFSSLFAGNDPIWHKTVKWVESSNHQLDVFFSCRWNVQTLHRFLTRKGMVALVVFSIPRPGRLLRFVFQRFQFIFLLGKVSFIFFA